MNSKDRPNSSRASADTAHSKLSFGDDLLCGTAIRSWRFHERLEESQVVKSASAVVYPHEHSRWDYHAQTVLEGPQGLRHDGFCIRAERQPDGGFKISLEGTPKRFERASVKSFETFGMSNLEVAYWFPLLTGMASKVVISDFSPNSELRPFLYAVPLGGLTCKGQRKSFFSSDFGVTSGAHDDLFGPCVAKSQLARDQPAWNHDAPKAWGIVLAKDFLEAEALSFEASPLHSRSNQLCSAGGNKSL